MRILVYLPIDRLVKNWARRLQADEHQVETTHTFSVFRRQLRSVDWVLMNSAKFDSPKYVWKIMLSLVLARLRGRRIAIFYSIDLVDLSDRALLRAVLWAINRAGLGCATILILLETRRHIAGRYGIPKERVLTVNNCPDREAFAPAQKRTPCAPDRPLTFLYHGELLWWHGLERFIPIYEEIKKRRAARLIVTGNFYRTVFRLFGLAAARREVRIKRALAAVLERPDVDYRGRVEFEDLKRLMAEADFHVTLLNNEDTQARTELRTCLLEAMAAGMACLHAATPAVSGEMFRDGENIVFVEPDDPARSAEKILAIAGKKGKLETIGRNAVQTVERHFDFETQYRKLLARLKAQSKSGIGR